MPAPVNKFIAVVIDNRGLPTGTLAYFATRNAANEGAKEMIRAAAQGASVYIYKTVAHLDMTVTYGVVDD